MKAIGTAAQGVVTKVGGWLKNPSIITLIIVFVIIYFIYKAGKNKGEMAANEPSFWDKLWGNDEESQVEVPIYTTGGGSSSGGGGSWSPKPLTDSIHVAYEEHWNLWGNGDRINELWGRFNTLSDSRRVMVVNDWNQRYMNTDRAGWGTGDYGTLKQTIERYADDLVPQAEIALTWMTGAGIQ
ncbi:hypothetical protein [Phaeocystidibacter luteus]|uniref:Uncharacterized protein n=1 Tax=Phaeocystidibacter luteus TaxID=911197 RepID=A0A6N6RLV1_9FLAO|nr:hypothetical protein [Phaeocystidibacter luteus]KAB2814559.1 hypothetical protein F8C67_02130 [Phaeocystidibacter luteus]